MTIPKSLVRTFYEANERFGGERPCYPVEDVVFLDLTGPMRGVMLGNDNTLVQRYDR